MDIAIRWVTWIFAFPVIKKVCLYWDCWMASLTQWTWVWLNSGSWWWTGRLACCSPGGRRVRHDWATQLNWYYTVVSQVCNSIMPKNVHTFTKGILLIKISIIWVFSKSVVLLVENLTSMLMAADWSGWWLLKAGVAAAIFKIKTMKSAASVDSSFYEQFLCSMQCCLIAFYPL